MTARKRHALAFVVLAMQTGLIFANPPAGGFALHVAPNGDDAADGSRGAPLRTLERARDELRRRRGGAATTRPGGEIVLHPGIYRLTATLAFDAQDSGKANAPFVLRAVEPGAARIVGGRQIPLSAIEPVSDPSILDRLAEPAIRPHLRRIDLRKLGVSDFGEVGPRGFNRPYLPAPLELFIDGRPQTLARWPNDDEPPVPLERVRDKGSVPRNGDFSQRPGVFEFGLERPCGWTRAREIFLTGFFAAGFADDTIGVGSIDPEAGVITLAQPHIYGLEARGYTAWRAINLLEEIDLPGEYFVDRNAGVLYFAPPEGFSTRSEVFVSELAEPLLAIENVSHLRVEGLVFEFARGSAAYVAGGHGVEFAGCTFRNLGMLAVQFGQGAAPLPDGLHDAHGRQAPGVSAGEPVSRTPGSFQTYIYAHSAWNRKAGTGHRVTGCDIHDTGAGGILLGGGDRATLTPGGNEVVNCHIRRVNRWERTYRPAVSLDGVGNRVAHCLIEDLPGAAVLVYGNDHVIEFNRIERAVTGSSDMGAIYQGRDPSAAGLAIRCNVIGDIVHAHPGNHGAHAVFVDDCAIIEEIRSNLFVRVSDSAALWFNSGSARHIADNVFVNCSSPIEGAANHTAAQRRFMQTELGVRRVREHVDIVRPPYSEHYPWLLALYEGITPLEPRVERNLVLVNPDAATRAVMDAPAHQRADGTFRDGNAAVTLPLDRIGLQVDAQRRVMPVPPPVFPPRLPHVVGRTVIALEPGERDARVVYTLDGSEPTAASPIYTAPIVITNAVLVRARTLRTGLQPLLSDTAERRYRPLRAELVNSARINFQPNDAPPPEGWLADTGEPFRDTPGQIAYGWNLFNRTVTRRRTRPASAPPAPLPPAARLPWTLETDPSGDGTIESLLEGPAELKPLTADTRAGGLDAVVSVSNVLQETLSCISDGTWWQIAVRPGVYRVQVGIGDVGYACEAQAIRAGDQWLCRGWNLDRNEFRVASGVVCVEDGILSLVSEPYRRPRQMRLSWIEIQRMEPVSASQEPR